MLKIDFHTHAFIDRIAEKAIPTLAERSHLAPQTNGTLSGLLSSMDKAGLDKSVVANIATNPKQMMAVNNFAIESDGGRFIQFGSVHPDAENWEDELYRLKENNIKGIKLHPDYQGFFVDEDKMLPVYEKITELGFILLFHAGYDIGFPDPVHLTPEGFSEVYKTLDTSRFVLAHMGGYKETDCFLSLLAGKSFYIDTAFTLNNEIPLEIWNEIINAHGTDKVLFATDCPWANQSSYVEEIYNRLPKETADKLISENPCRLLGL